jgi:oligoribonuclease (3'-5' exoribonuclease)
MYCLIEINKGEIMSIDNDRHYIVEAEDEENYFHFTAEDSYIVKEEFAKWYPQLKIKAIYLQVYSVDDDCEE